MNSGFDQPLVSYVLICYNRKNDLREALYSILAQDYEPIEIIVVDNNSSDGTEGLFEAEFALANIHFEKLSENLGVSGGRNIAMRKAQGEILIVIDDDAIVVDPHATAMVVEKLETDPSIGALGFKILDYHTRDIQKGYRIRRGKALDLNSEFDTWGFRGAGHAMRRRVFEEVGPYPDYFPWGNEEFDIALKILDAGYRIVYFPRVEIAHKRSVRGRLPETEFVAVALENRIKIAIRNLPWRYVLTTAVIWTGINLVRTRFDLKAVLLAYRSLWRKRHVLLKERSPLCQETLKKASKLGAPLYY